MAVICLGSARAAPGATTLAVVMAALWPRPVVLVEADAHGGVLALRYGLSRHPGLTDLAASLRESPSPEVLLRAAQSLPGGDLPVAVAPESGKIAAHVLADVANSLGSWLAAIDGLDVVVDCGRFGPRSSAVPLLANASDVLVVARPRADELYAAAHWLAEIPAGQGAGLVLVGERPYGRDEVAGQFGVRVAGVVADDPGAAGTLVTGRGALRPLRFSMLVRSVRSLVDDLTARLGLSPTGDVSEAANEVVGTRAVRRPGRWRRASTARAEGGGGR
jgi:hypothetical protein